MPAKYSDQFYEWLDQCPVVWLRLDENDIHSTYRFYEDLNKEDDDVS